MPGDAKRRAATSATTRIPRAQRTRAIQARIDAAAMRLLSSRGVDGLALTRIASEAGLSNGPLYGRYDSGEDVALELWESSIRDHGRRLTEEVAAFLFGSDDDMSPWLRSELTDRSDLTIAHAEIVAVARRYPLRSESIHTELEQRMNSLRTLHPEVPESLRSIAVTFPIGFALHRDLLPGAGGNWANALIVCREFAADRSLRKLPARDVEPLELDLPVPATGDETLDEFVGAVMSVVSKVGFERTTAHRVARAAGHSFSTAYGHVGSKDELMIVAIGTTIAQTVSIGEVSFLQLEGDAYIDRVCALWKALVGDRGRPLRQLRVEVFLAAAHHGELGDRLREAFAESISFVPTLLGGTSTQRIDDAMVFWHLTRAVGLGQVVVSLDSAILRDIDWTPIATGAKRLADAVFYDHIGRNHTDMD